MATSVVQTGTTPTNASNRSSRNMIEGNNQPARSEDYDAIHIGNTIPIGNLGYGITSDDNVFGELVMLPPRRLPPLPKNSEWLPSAQ